MTVLLWCFAVWTGLLILGIWAAAAASIWHFRRRGVVSGLPLLPMTLIKPIRGLDDAMQRSFQSILAADPGKSLQLIIALETVADPAYPVACALRDGHPDRDIEVVLAGPSGGRMGKIHNMIEALPRAKHPIVIFSDADSCVSPALLAQTSDAFRAGCEACFGLPYHPPVPGVGGFLFQIAFNHSYSPTAVLASKLGQLRFCAGAWMAYTKLALERAGGLEQFAHAIADDFAISWRVASLGLRRRLLREPVVVEETGTSAREAFTHIVKWLRIVRSCVPAAYFLTPLLSPGVCAAALWALCAAAGWRPELGLGLFAAAVLSRAATALWLDCGATRRRMSAAAYLAVAFVDLGMLGFWLLGFPSTISWRGTRYRLSWGGTAEVVA